MRIGDCPAEWRYRIGFLHCKHNTIEHNEVHDVMERLADGNGIYVSGYRRRQHHPSQLCAIASKAWAAIQPSGWMTASGTRVVSENVIWRINGGGLTLKGVNEMDNNIVVDCHRYGSMAVRSSPAFGSMVVRNIFVQSGAELTIPGLISPFYDGRGLGG